MALRRELIYAGYDDKKRTIMRKLPVTHRRRRRREPVFSINVIRKTAGWTPQSQTFAKFYDRSIEVSDGSGFAEAILDLK